MAFDKKRQRTFKELVKLTKIPRYIKSGYNPMGEHVFARFGRFYATNGYMIVCVEYPEFEFIADDEWMMLERFEDENGKLLETPELVPAERQFKSDMFEQFFIDDMCVPNQNLPVDARLLMDALSVFKINGLAPTVFSDGSRYELSAHNKDVSIKAVVMGLRSKQ